jgi:hypothetical protein
LTNNIRLQEKVDKEMPLKEGKSKKVIKENIRREIASGRPVDQAVAISYAAAGRSRPKKRKKNG